MEATAQPAQVVPPTAPPEDVTPPTKTTVPSAITWKWHAAGEFDTVGFVRGRTYEVAVGLMLKGIGRGGWEKPLTLQLELPDGRKPSPVTVDPKDIPLASFLDFSFPSFVADGPGLVKLVATTTQTGNLQSVLVVADQLAKIRVADQQAKIIGTSINTDIPLYIIWKWELSGELESKSLEKGTTYGLALPLMLDGESTHGWVNPLQLELQLSQGKNPSPRTLYPQDIPLGQYKDLTLPEFVNQGVGKISFRAATTQEGNLQSSLALAGAQAKINKTYGHVPMEMQSKWTASGEFDAKVLGSDSTCTPVIPLMLKGSTKDGWKNAVTLKVDLPDGQSPAPTTVQVADIPLGQWKEFSFPEFNPSKQSGTIRLTVETTQEGNLMSALVVDGGNAKIKQDQLVPMSFTSSWKATGELDCTGIQTGTKYSPVLPLMINGESHDGWENPLSLELQLPDGDGRNPSPRVLYLHEVPLGKYQDFSFPEFVNQGSGKVKFEAVTAQKENLQSTLVVADGNAKYEKMFGEVDVSFDWTWMASGEFETKPSDVGSIVEVAVPLMLNATSYDGFVNPVILHLERTEGESPQDKSLPIKDIPLGTFKLFSFPTFVAQGQEKVKLTITTTQNANSLGALVVDQEEATINKNNCPIPMSITWNWTAKGELDGSKLREGSTYDVALPLMLNGKSHEGWTNPFKLRVELPAAGEGVNPPPNTIYPQSILLGSFCNFSFPSFVASGLAAGKVLLSATTMQATALQSPLIVANQKANIKEL